MLMYIIAGVVAVPVLCVGLWFAAESFFDIDRIDGLLVAVMALASAFVVFAAVAAGTTAIANVSVDHQNYYKKYDLVAIRDTTSVGGEFFLGSGAIGGTGNYVFYYRDGKAKQLVNVDGADVKVYEDTDKPYAIQFAGCDLKPNWLADCFHSDPSWTEIHVPAGSIREGVNLNLGK